MPWSHTSSLDQQPPCMADDLRASPAIPGRCQLSPISRTTGAKGIARDLQDGPAGLDERSRTPNPCPRPTPAAVVAAILEARRPHPIRHGPGLHAPPSARS
jgi:hypothetical protein